MNDLRELQPIVLAYENKSSLTDHVYRLTHRNRQLCFVTVSYTISFRTYRVIYTNKYKDLYWFWSVTRGRKHLDLPLNEGIVRITIFSGQQNTHRTYDGL